jgi:proliferating cell nuclear antigen PCNA
MSVFKATVKNTKHFRQFLEAISVTIEETNIFLNSEGIYIKAPDATVIAICEARYDISEFEEYIYTKDIIIGLSLPNFIKIVKSSESMTKEKLTISIENDPADILHFSFGSSLFFELKLMDLEYEDLMLTTTESDYKYAMIYDSAIFSKSISNCLLFSDKNIDIKSDEGIISFGAEGDIGKCRHKQEAEEVINSSEDLLEISFPINYINKFTKADFLSDTVIFCVDNDNPLLLKYSCNETFIRFFLAPKLPD